MQDCIKNMGRDGWYHMNDLVNLNHLRSTCNLDFFEVSMFEAYANHGRMVYWYHGLMYVWYKRLHAMKYEFSLLLNLLQAAVLISINFKMTNSNGTIYKNPHDGWRLRNGARSSPCNLQERSEVWACYVPTWTGLHQIWLYQIELAEIRIKYGLGLCLSNKKS